MNWFKLTLDKSGAILTCEQVDAAEKNGTLTCYVQATTKAEACSAAKAWNDRRRATINRCQTERRKDRATRGLCQECGNRPIHKPKSPHCRECLDRRMQVRNRPGGPLPKPHLTPEQALEYVRQYEAARRGKRPKRVSVQTVLEILDRAGPDALRRWLVELIEKGEAAPPF